MTPALGLMVLATVLAGAAGAGLAWGVLAERLRRQAEERARLAESLLERAARRRSDAVAQGNRTRAAERRERTRMMTEQLRADTAERLAREAEDLAQMPLGIG